MLSNHPNCLGGNGPSASSDLIGDVDGPASATDNAVARFDGTTGKLIQNSVVTIADTTGDIAGAQSLTSPASSPLTLGTGTSGAAVTVLSADNNVGIGTVSPSAKLQTQSNYATSANDSDDADATILIENIHASGDAVLRMRGATGVSSVVYGKNGGTDRLNFIPRNDNGQRIAFNQNGVVSISNTTAGSSGVGALIVQGGISAGNTGAASYFGGAVTATGSTTSGLSLFAGGSSSGAGATSVEVGINRSSTATGGALKFYTAGSQNWYVGLGATGTNTDIEFYNYAGSLVALKLANTTGAATFAGAVTVSSTTPTATLTRTSGTDSPRLNYDTGTASAIIGMSGTAGGLVGSSIDGDLVLRTAASKSIRFTVDGGGSSAAVLSSTGATFAGDVSAQRLEAVDAAANNRAAAFFRTQNNTTYSSSVLSIQGDRTTTNASYNLIYATNGDTTGVFAVRDSGNAVNTNNSYGSTSDRKLKENIVDATSKLEKLNQVRIVNFNRIGNEQKQLGVIAQELEQIFPSMIEEAIDRDAEGNDLGTTTKSVKYSVFVPMLIKAMQELTARLATLEAK